MSASLLLALTVGSAFLGGGLAGWRVRRAMGHRPGSPGHNALLAMQMRNEMLQASAKLAHERAASSELDMSAALMTMTHLEIEVDRLTKAVDEANAEADSANAWVRKIWRERAMSQGAAHRHPSARIDERATPPASPHRPIATVRTPAGGGSAEPGRDSARWN